jgi:antitoxin (DNA-binding transcriptional repressor) of toxin-antitoxin stability system
MKRASVGDLRYRFPEIERAPQQGTEIEITKRSRVIARLLSATHELRRPDFLARLREIYGDKTLKMSGAQLLAQERERF